MDSLDPLGASDIKKYTLNDFYDTYNNGNFKFKGGYIRIWGDFKSRKLDNLNEIETVKVEDKILKISFKNQYILTVWSPEAIITSNNIFKIPNARKVKWLWLEENTSKEKFFIWRNEIGGIHTETNSKWKVDVMDIIISQPAVFIYNNSIN